MKSSAPLPLHSEPRPVRVALVEDDPRFCDRVRRICSTNSTKLSLVGVFTSVEEATEGLPALQPEVVLVDIRLPGASGIDLVRTLSPVMRNTYFTVLTVIPDWGCIYEAIRAGALGYLLKREAEEHLLELILDLRAGGSPMSNSIARRVLLAFQQRIAGRNAEDDLTPREEEVVISFSYGLTNKEIAEKFGISPGTVRTHAQNIFKKLNVRSRLEAVDALNRHRWRA